MAALSAEAMSQLAQVMAQTVAQAVTQSQGPLLQTLQGALEGWSKPRDDKGRIDSRSIGGPPEWDSNKEENAFTEWQLKLKAWLGNQDERALDWLKIARESDDRIETNDLVLQSFATEQDRHDCKKFNATLNTILMQKLHNEAVS